MSDDSRVTNACILRAYLLMDLLKQENEKYSDYRNAHGPSFLSLVKRGTPEEVAGMNSRLNWLLEKLEELEGRGEA